jgi:type IV pilus assembly protein PilY1
VANGGVPLFTARNSNSEVQPITSQPRIGAHPNGGVLVHFGTGQYMTLSDIDSTEIQSYYAIWDNGSPVTTTDRSELQVQSIVSQTIEFGQSVRETSANTIDWSTKRGWYLDLEAGERITVRPLLIYDRTLFLTRKPSRDQCSPGGQSWLVQLEAATGSRYATAVFDINNDDQFDSNDLLASGNVPSGILTTVGIASTPVFLTGTGGGYGGAIGQVGAIGTPVSPTPNPSNPTSAPSPDYAVISGTSGGTQTFKIAPVVPPPAPPGGGSTPARVYWQQIL